MLFIKILWIIILAAPSAFLLALLLSSFLTDSSGSVGGDAWEGFADLVFSAGICFFIFWVIISGFSIWLLM